MRGEAQNCSRLTRRSSGYARLASFFLAFLLVTPLAQAQECASGSDLDAATAHALSRASTSYFQMAAAGDFAGLKQSAIASVVADFSGIEQAVGANRDNLQQAQATQRTAYLLTATGTSALPRAEFFCGIFNSLDHVTFVFSNLPPGRYGVVVDDVSGGKQPVVLTLILYQQNGSWKLAGLTVKPRLVAGHDSAWFAAQAAQYHAKGDNFTAWLYYLEAWDLAEPAGFMYTPARDRIVDALQPVRPSDAPSKEHPMLLVSGSDTYRVTETFPDSVGNDLVLVVKYQAVSDISNTGLTFTVNSKVIKAMVTRFPGLRDAFASVVARAVDSSGRDYGTLMSMKDVK